MRCLIPHKLPAILPDLPRFQRNTLVTFADLFCLEVKDPEVNLAKAKQLVIVKQGIDADTGRKVSRLIKDSKLKVQAQIQGDKVRIIGKKRDDLQEAIAFLRKSDVGMPLQFNNFRD